MDFDKIDKDICKVIVDNLYDGLYLVDRERKIIYWNKAAEKISGYKAEEVIGRYCSDNILTHIDSEGKQLCLGHCPLAKCMLNSKPNETELYLHHKDGHRIPVSVRISPMTDVNGKVIGGIELFSDISNRSTYELKIKELEKMAFLDNLTKLANRNYIQKEMQIRFAELKRFGIRFGILFIDIDNFKSINDKYGHDTGDAVLKYTANTFISHSRPFDIYGRWGGEEFIGILHNISGEDLKNTGNRLRTLVETSYIIQNGSKLNVTISIGATLAMDNDDPETLTKRADLLLYESKNNGRNRLTIDI